MIIEINTYKALPGDSVDYYDSMKIYDGESVKKIRAPKIDARSVYMMAEAVGLKDVRFKKDGYELPVSKLKEQINFGEWFE